MATDTTPLTLRMQRIDRKYDVRVDLGTVTFGAEGLLTVAAAAHPQFANYLTSLVEMVNAKPEISIKAPPPEGAKPHSVYFLTVARTAPDLLDMMRQYFEQKFDILLVEPAEV